MRRRIVVLFPGQGAQRVGMFAQHMESPLPSVHRILNRAQNLFGSEFINAVKRGPQGVLDDTRHSQAAVFVAGLCAAETAKADGRLLLDSNVSSVHVAGLSIGEITALAFLRMIDLDDAMRLVAARGEAMARACSAAPSTMVSVAGASTAQLFRATAVAADLSKGQRGEDAGESSSPTPHPGPYVSNFLWPTGSAVGGGHDALKVFSSVVTKVNDGGDGGPQGGRGEGGDTRAAARLRFASRTASTLDHLTTTPTAKGGAPDRAQRVRTRVATKVRVQPLSVAGAFHTPFMLSAEAPLCVALSGIRVKAPCVSAFGGAVAHSAATPADLWPLSVEGDRSAHALVGGGARSTAGLRRLRTVWLVESAPCDNDRRLLEPLQSGGGGDSERGGEHALVVASDPLAPASAVSTSFPRRSRDVSSASTVGGWSWSAPPAVAWGQGATLATFTKTRPIGLKRLTTGPIGGRGAGPEMELTGTPLMPLFPPREGRGTRRGAYSTPVSPSRIAVDGGAAASLLSTATPTASPCGGASSSAVSVWRAAALEAGCDMGDDDEYDPSKAVGSDGVPRGRAVLGIAPTLPWGRVYANVCGSAAHYDGLIAVQDAALSYEASLSDALHAGEYEGRPTSGAVDDNVTALAEAFAPPGDNCVGGDDACGTTPHPSSTAPLPPPVAPQSSTLTPAVQDSSLPTGDDVAPSPSSVPVVRTAHTLAVSTTSGGGGGVVPHSLSHTAIVHAAVPTATHEAHPLIRSLPHTFAGDLFVEKSSRSGTSGDLSVSSTLSPGRVSRGKDGVTVSSTSGATTASTLPPHLSRLVGPLGSAAAPPPGVEAAVWRSAFSAAAAAKGLSSTINDTVDRAAVGALTSPYTPQIGASAQPGEKTTPALPRGTEGESEDRVGEVGGVVVCSSSPSGVANLSTSTPPTVPWESVANAALSHLPLPVSTSLSVSPTQSDCTAAAVTARAGGLGALPTGPHGERVNERGWSPSFASKAGDLTADMVRGSVASARRDASDDAAAVGFDVQLRHLLSTHADSVRGDLTRALLVRQLASPVQFSSILRRCFDGFVDTDVARSFAADAAALSLLPATCAVEDAEGGWCNDGAERLDVFCLGDSAHLPAIVKRWVGAGVRGGTVRLTSVV